MGNGVAEVIECKMSQVPLERIFGVNSFSVEQTIKVDPDFLDQENEDLYKEHDHSHEHNHEHSHEHKHEHSHEHKHEHQHEHKHECVDDHCDHKDHHHEHDKSHSDH